MFKPLFNINTITSFIRYISCLLINLSSPSKSKQLKSEFRGLLLYILLSNNNLIVLTFNLSVILLVKLSIGSFVKNLCLSSIGKSPKSEFRG